MKLSTFITENRVQLEQIISGSISRVPKTASCFCPLNGTNHHHKPPKLTREDLRAWILNDERLYNWARSSGVRI